MPSEPEAREFQACLFGASLDVDNLGVRALACSLVKLVADSRPGARIALLYGSRIPGKRAVQTAVGPISVDVVNFRLSPRSRWREHLFFLFFLAALHRLIPIAAVRARILGFAPFLGTIGRSDFIGDINGGDSFADIYGLRRFLLGIAPLFLTWMIGKPYVLLPQTYGPYSSWIARRLAGFLIRRAERIYARDERSLQEAMKFLTPRTAARARLSPDVAFTLEARPPAAAHIEPPIEPVSDRPLVGLNVSGLLYQGGYTRDNMFGLKSDYPSFVRALAERFLAETDARLLLVPHALGENEAEGRACREVWEAVRAKHPGRAHLLRIGCDQSEIKHVIGQCDLFMGSRMHACIAGLSQGVPSIGLAYSRKFVGVFATLGVGDLALDVRAEEAEALIERCLGIFRDRFSYERKLAASAPKARERVKEIFREELSAQGAAETAERRPAEYGQAARG